MGIALMQDFYYSLRILYPSEILVTPTGLARLKSNLEQTIKEYDQLNTNSRMRLMYYEEIQRLNYCIAQAKLVSIQDKQRPQHCIEVGSLVSLVRWTDRGIQPEEIWEVLGHGETDIPNKRIAYDTKLGLALLGRKAGDYITDFWMDSEYLDLEIIRLLSQR